MEQDEQIDCQQKQEDVKRSRVRSRGDEPERRTGQEEESSDNAGQRLRRAGRDARFHLLRRPVVRNPARQFIEQPDRPCAEERAEQVQDEYKRTAGKQGYKANKVIPQQVRHRRERVNACVYANESRRLPWIRRETKCQAVQNERDQEKNRPREPLASLKELVRFVVRHGATWYGKRRKVATK